MRTITLRLLAMIPVAFGVATLVYVTLQLLPGDPARMMIEGAGGGSAGAYATEELVRDLRKQLGLDDPILIQYGRFLHNALRGDLGKSFLTGRPVAQIVWEQWPATVELALAALFLATTLGILLGVVAGLRQGTWIDSLTITTSVLGVSVPSYWLGLILILFFSVKLNLLPAVRGTGLAGLVLPAVALGAADVGAIARLVRSSLLDVLGVEYITTARAKGLPERIVIHRHALRNALIPAVTFTGLRFGHLLGGAVVVETVFARQGLGFLLKEAVLGKDYPVIVGSVLIIALCFAFANLVVDISYILIDPRIREV